MHSTPFSRHATEHAPRSGAGTSGCASNSGDSAGSSGALDGGSASTARMIRRASSSWRASALSGAVARAEPAPRPAASNDRSWRLSSGAGASVRVVPEARAGIEAVQRQELPAFVREQVDGLDDVVEDGLADEVVEADAGEREGGAQAALPGLRVHRRRPGVVDRMHAMDVRAGAEAAAARLDPEQVAQHRDDEVRVQQPARVAEAERHDREPLALGVAEDLDVRVAPPGRERAACERVLPPADLLGADRLLEREHEPGADRLDDRRRTGLLADRRVRVVGLAGRAHEHDRPAARDRRHAAAQERALGDEDPGRAGAAGELVRREEDRVLGGHVDRQVRARGGVVEAGERAVPVEHLREPLDVRDDPGDVRRGGEAADLERAR